jgi:hypothetical protein
MLPDPAPTGWHDPLGSLPQRQSNQVISPNWWLPPACRPLASLNDPRVLETIDYMKQRK